MKKIIIILIIILLIGCKTPPFIENPSIIIPKENSSEIKVYFCPKNNCEFIFIKAIENSTEIKCALHDLNLKNLTNTLKQKNAKIILDDNYMINYSNVKYDTSSQITHNKFCIFNNTIITGSMNPTERGAYKNNNNILIIKSKYLSKNYEDEFNELWNNKFGKGKKVKYPKILFNNKSIENYFCPEDNCKDHVIKALNNANSSIYFLTFSFTDKDIANLLIKKSKFIEIKGVMEKKRINMQYNNYKFLKENKINVIPDKNSYTMHHKIFIIDNNTVITGSYNPTKSANEKNDENILIIHDKKIAEKYVKEFKSLFN